MITSAWLLRATVIAIIGSLLGALYPALKAAQKDPITRWRTSDESGQPPSYQFKRESHVRSRLQSAAS